MSTPRVVYAYRDRPVRVHMPGRTLPVIVVPDIFGTRLTDPDSDTLVWNPKGPPFGEDPRAYAVKLERLLRMSAELVPDETHRYPLISKNRASIQAKVRHGFGMVSNVYKGLCELLVNGAGADAFAELGVRRKVYFCGYDWRQDNARSALRLSEMVEEALEETGERQVVLVGHGMGGQICRYYCRALGGEPKVHQLFLLGTPLLGTPAAFGALKHGIEGLYVRELTDAARAGRAGALVFEVAAQGANVLAAAGAHGARGALGTLFGELYMLLSLSAGKWLSRAETRRFARQMPSVYQMLPGAVHCRENLHWVVFDPLATGVAPTGYMVPMPTVFSLHMDATIALLAMGNDRLQGEMQAAVREFMEGPSEGVPSARASCNAMPFVQMIARALRVQAIWAGAIDRINWNAPDIWAEFGKLGETGKALRAEMELLVAAFQGFGGQATRTFVDCRNPRRLYEDIYTGLLDAVEERPLVSASLPLFYRFDEALTVTPREEKPLSLLDALLRLLTPVMSAAGDGLRAFFFGFAAMWNGPRTGEVYQQWQREHAEAALARRLDDQAAEDARTRARTRGRVYLPPNTYIVYSTGEVMPSGCLLQPRAFVSQDDSNLVPSFYVADLAAPGHPGATSGDGFVPGPSACPDDRVLARPFGPRRGADTKDVPNTRHSALPADQATLTFIEEKLADKLHDFLRAGAGG